MNPIIFETQFNESGSRVYFMRLGRLYRFKTENGDLEYVSTTSVCIDQEIKYASLHESLGILFVVPFPSQTVGSQRMKSTFKPSTVVRFDLRSKEMIDSRSFGRKDLRKICMNRNYIALVFRTYIKIYHAYNFKEALQKFETSDNPEGVVSLSQKRDILAFPTPGPPGAMTVLKLGGSYLRKQEWAKVVRTPERDKWMTARLSRNGNYLALVSLRGTSVRVMEIRTQNQLYEFKIRNPHKRICGLEFSPDNKYLGVLCPNALYIFRISKLLEPKGASSPQTIVIGGDDKKEVEDEEDKNRSEAVEKKEAEQRKSRGTGGTSVFFSLFGGGGKKSMVGKYNFKSGDFPECIRFTGADSSVVMVATKRGIWTEMKFEYDMTSREKKKFGYPVDGPIRVSERTIEESMSGEQLYLSSLGIIAKERTDENEFVFQCIARRDTPNPAPQIKPTEIIVNQNTGQTVRWLSNIIRVRISSTASKGGKSGGDNVVKGSESSAADSERSGWGSDDSDEAYTYGRSSRYDDDDDDEDEEEEEEEGEDDELLFDGSDGEDVTEEEENEGEDENSSSSRSKGSKNKKKMPISLKYVEEQLRRRRRRRMARRRNKKKEKKKNQMYIFVNGELQDGDEELYRLFQKYRSIQHPSTRHSSMSSAGMAFGGRSSRSLRAEGISAHLDFDSIPEGNSPGLGTSPNLGEFSSDTPPGKNMMIDDIGASSAPFGSVLSSSPMSSNFDGSGSEDSFGRFDLPETVVAMKRNRILRIFYSYVHQPTTFAHISSPKKMSIRLSRHTSNLIDSEKGYIFGGVNLSRGKFRLSSHLYNVEFMEGKVMEIGKVHLGLYGTTSPVRYSHSSFYDPEERNLYIFGGSDDRSFSGELYVFALGRKKWEKVECKGILPLPRIDCGIVYRRRCRKAILWGGFVGSLRRGEYCNELYELDLQHKRWNKFFRLSNDLIPVGRSKHFLRLFADESKMLLHGGFHDFQPCYDTWTYNFSSHQWTRLSIMAPFPNPLACHIFRKYVVVVSEDLAKVHIFHLRNRNWKKVYVVKGEDDESENRQKEEEEEEEEEEELNTNIFGGKNGRKGSAGRRRKKNMCLSMASSLSNNRNIIYIFGGETRDRESVESYYIVDFSHYVFE